MIDIPEMTRMRVMLEHNSRELTRMREEREQLRNALTELVHVAKAAGLDRGGAVLTAEAVLSGRPVRIRLSEQQ